MVTDVSSLITFAIEEISSTVRLASWIAATCCEISSVARGLIGKGFHLGSTTAKPRPDSPHVPLRSSR